MRISIVRTAWITGMVALAACRSPTAHHPGTVVTITPDQPAYTAGSMAAVTVQNVTPDPVGYNLCEHLIERRVLGTWTVVEHFPPPSGACTQELRTLQPGASVTVQVQLPASLEAGTYRVEFPGIAGNTAVEGKIDRASVPFTVQRPTLVPVD